MLKNYFKMAMRNITRKKLFSGINIFGLSIGIGSCLIMLMYVVNELSYDDYHKNKDRIYRVAMEWGQEGKQTKFTGIFPGVGPEMRDKFPEVEKSVRLQRISGGSIAVNNTEYEENNLFFAEPSLFDIFTFEILEGNRNEFLVEPSSAILTESIAKKYFGTTGAIGKMFTFNNQLIKVSGVIKDIPQNSHLNTEIIISYSTLKTMGMEADQPWNSWGSTYTYFLLKSGQSASEIPAKLSTTLYSNAGDFMGKSTQFVLQKLSDIHFISDFRPDIGPKGNILYLYIFLSASILILVLGCFNYVNLTVSMYMNRMSEVGIRKVFGAKKSHLLTQFLSDSLLITAISLLIGIVLFQLTYKDVYNYLGTKVVLSFRHLKYFLFIIFGMILFVGIIAGGYPALFLSKFKPIEIMRKNLTSFSSGLSFRKVIVILQSAITIILITGTIIIYSQLDYLKNADLGFNKQNVAIVSLFGIQDAEKYYPTFSEELRKHSGIEAVSGSFMVPGSSSAASMSVLRKGSANTDAVRLTNVAVDFDYVKSLGIKIIQGRDFSRNYPSDAIESVLINESAVKELGFINPVGEQLLIPVGPVGKTEMKNVNIVGIVKDFHMKSKHQKIAPMIFYMVPNYAVCIIKMAPTNIPGTIQYINNTWKKIFPGTNITINYLDALVDKMYRAEEKIGNFTTGFTIIAIIISCLGLYALTTFIVNRKIKEVGIRKVLGAENSDLVFGLSKKFMAWVLIANIVAAPMSYFLTNLWLQDFAYKIQVSPWIYVFSGIIALVISFLSIMFRVIKSARANPVETLKYE